MIAVLVGFGAVPQKGWVRDGVVEGFSDRNILHTSLRNVDPASITAPGRTVNFENYVEAILHDVKKGKAGDIAVFDIDRGFDAVHRPCLTYDEIPPFRVRGPQYFLISTHDLQKPWDQRQFHRWLTTSERFKLQGYVGGNFDKVLSQSFQLRSTGNAYSVHMVGTVMLPIVAMIARNPELMTRTLTESELANLAELHNKIQLCM